jgi:hypothetical protein
MNINTVRIIGQVLENSWGRESSPSGTYSVKYDLAGDLLTLKFTTVMHMAGEAAYGPQVSEANRQAVTLINDKLATVKKAFKEETGSTLKTEDMGGKDDVELIQPHASRRVAYYRYNHSFKIKN